MRTVIGIDPGLASTGWGVVRFDGSRFLHVGHGVVTTDPGLPLAERLLHIHREITRVISAYAPTEAGVEDLYFAKNATSAIHVAHARGVVLLALGERGVPVGTYSPQQVKQAVIGRGKAAKDQVQRLVGVVLGLEEMPGPDHAADALAVAICHANRSEWAARQASARGGSRGAAPRGGSPPDAQRGGAHRRGTRHAHVQ